MYLSPIALRQQKLVVAASIIFALLPATAVTLRIVARRIANRKLEYSDYLIIAACVVAVIYQGVVLSAVLAGGLGYHYQGAVKMGGNQSFVALMKTVLVVQILWSISLGLTKGSILILYAKVFSMPPFVLASRITAVLILVWALVLIIAPFVMCQPLAYNWDPTIPGGSCKDPVSLWVTTGVFNIITDLIVILLPMPYLYSLDLALYKKVALMCTFGIGLLVCIVSAIRLKILLSIQLVDFSGTGAIGVMFSALEPCLLITAACLPLLRPLLGRNYSSTGTAQNVGIVSYKSAISGCKMGFSKLENFASLQRLRPDGVHYDAAVASGHVVSDTNTSSSYAESEMELSAIKVKKDWVVEEGFVGR